jgi:hypothetical protein
MKSYMILFAVMGTLVLLAIPVSADWDPSMPTKWVQLPDLSGMDVNATWQTDGTPQPVPVPPFVKVLADDFPCNTTGLITGIHVWGSWLNDKSNPNTTFHLSIHDDVPASPNGLYSHPGKVLWEMDFSPTQYIEAAPVSSQENFYDPNTNQVIGRDTQAILYNFPIPPALAFKQMGTAANPLVYWLDVQAVVPPGVAGEPADVFGWKTTSVLNHWGDDATFADTNLPLSMGGTLVGPAASPVFWSDMHYPLGFPNETKSIDLAFAITTTVPEPGTFVLLTAGGLGLVIGVWRRRRLAA